MRWIGLAGLAAGAALLAAACSGGDGGASPSSSTESSTTTAGESPAPTEPSTTPSPTTTAAPTTTDVESTTTSVAESSTTVETPTTTTLPDGVPPRLTFPDDPDKQAVVDAAYAFFDAARAAQADPANESLRAALAQTMTDPIAERMTIFLDRLVDRNERVLPSPEQPTYLEIFAPTVFAIEDSGIFDACGVDGDVRVSGPIGNESVVDGDLVSGLQTYSLLWDGSRWRVRDFTTSARFEGQLGCG